MTDDKAILAALERCRTHIELIGEHLKRLRAAVDLIAAALNQSARPFVPGDHVRFIDPALDHCEWTVDRVDNDWVYVSLSTDLTYHHFAKPEQLRLISPP